MTNNESSFDAAQKAETGAFTAASPSADADSVFSWDELGLSPASLSALAALGFKTPTEVQAKSIRRVASGEDLLVQAKTGSGKTLAFGLPILERLDPARPVVQALVLVPTRELALQVATEIARVGGLAAERVVAVFGGASMNTQIERLKAGAQIVVATPGRLLDHLGRGTLKLNEARILVLDEADEMLDRGFLPDVGRIIEHLPKERQTMLFSATLPLAIENLSARYMKNPESIQIGKAGLSVNVDITHLVYQAPRFYKFVTLVNVLHLLPVSKALIFCNQKSEVENLAAHLHEEGFSVGFLTGDLSQTLRQRILTAFKDGAIDLLVATDLAARGIDIYGVSHVFNYELPENKELYVHRTGRTGRAGRRGVAVNIVGPHELLAIGTISKALGLPFIDCTTPSKEEVDANVKRSFVARLVEMENDGYPDDLSLLADELLEAAPPYNVVAGLLTLLRRQGFELPEGYDPENPSPKERLFARPALLGLELGGSSRERRSHGGEGSHRGGGRRPPRTDAPRSRGERPEAPKAAADGASESGPSGTPKKRHRRRRSSGAPGGAAPASEG